MFAEINNKYFDGRTFKTIEAEDILILPENLDDPFFYSQIGSIPGFSGSFVSINNTSPTFDGILLGSRNDTNQTRFINTRSTDLFEPSLTAENSPSNLLAICLNTSKLSLPNPTK